MTLAAWRLIPPIAAPGQQQMALDTWLLEEHRSGRQPAILRFYTWQPAAISLGYHQRQWPAAWGHLVWQGQGVDLVRRPSGGRAVLHQGDLTYAVITSQFQGKRPAVYEAICQFLITGWRILGVDLTFGQTQRGYIHNPNCFGTATAADLITPEGYKLVGSAQLRRDEAVLQHGTMRLRPNPQFHEQVFGIPLPPFYWQPDLAVSDAHSQVMAALVQGAERCWEVTFDVKPLSAVEQEAATDLYQMQRVDPG